MLGDSINIINFNCNPAVLKEIGKTSKNCHFWTQLAQKRSVWAMPQTKKQFFSEITKADHKFSKTFHFIKISYVLAEL